MAPVEGLTTDAVLLLDERVRLSCRELDRAFSEWKLDPGRFVGFLPGGDSEYSLVSDSAAFVHRFYLSRRIFDKECASFLLSAYVSTLSAKQPIALASGVRLPGDYYSTPSPHCLSRLMKAAGRVSQPVKTRIVGR